MTEDDFKNCVDGMLSGEYFDGRSDWSREQEGQEREVHLSVIRYDDFEFPRFARTWSFLPENWNKVARNMIAQLALDLFWKKR